MSRIHYVLMGAIALAIGGITIACFDPKRPLASDYARNPSHAIATTEETTLKRAIDPGTKAHTGQSSFELLTRGEDSLLLRIAMIEAAERSLDLQYYMIQDDVTGKLLLEAVLRAADRGVRVRILMDDLNMRGSDPTWTLLNAHPHIEIRIFNPFATRDEPLFTCISNVFTGLSQFSKRMHNKVLIADNQLAIAGGRNLGDSYFDASGDFNFRDVDVLAAGPIVFHLSQSFDKYWNDDEAFPITALLKPRDAPEEVNKLHEELRQHWQEEMQKGTIVLQVPLAAQLEQDKLPLLWANAELAADSPSKIDAPKEIAVSKPGFRLDKMADEAQHEFIIVSPYYVPGDEGTGALQALVKRGVKVRVLTNSLASIDAVAAFTGYRRYRQALVDGGIDLYEMKPIPGTHPHSRRFSSSSRDSLHSKIYVVDRRDVMIGSFNLDPRSVSLNTEMVLIIHSPALAEQLVSMFAKAISPTLSFHLIMHDGHLEWSAMENNQEEHYESEPKAGFWRDITVNLFALLPLEGQL